MFDNQIDKKFLGVRNEKNNKSVLYFYTWTQLTQLIVNYYYYYYY